MLYATLADVPQALRATSGLTTSAAGVWVTPRECVVDVCGVLPFSRAGTLQGDGTTTSQVIGTNAGITGAIEKVGNLIQLTALSTHTSTGGAKRSQITIGHRRLKRGRRYVMTMCLRLDGSWDTAAASQRVLLMQLNDNADAGEVARTPSLAVNTNGSNLDYLTRTDSSAISASSDPGINYTVSGAITTGAFFTISAEVTLSHVSGVGNVRFWKDRTAVAAASTLPVGYNDVLGPHAAFAAYCFDTMAAVTTRVLSVKGFRIYESDTFTVSDACDVWDSHPAT